MEIVNSTASGVYTSEYKNKNMPKQTYENSVKKEIAETKNKVLGMGFLHEKYIMGCALCMRKIIQRIIRLLK